MTDNTFTVAPKYRLKEFLFWRANAGHERFAYEPVQVEEIRSHISEQIRYEYFCRDASGNGQTIREEQLIGPLELIERISTFHGRVLEAIITPPEKTDSDVTKAHRHVYSWKYLNHSQRPL